MKVSVCIPCKNQSSKCLDNIKQLVIPYFDRCGIVYDLLVCYDGSDEENRRIMEEGFASLPAQCHLLDYENHSGKGHNVQKCFLEANADYVLFMDADISTSLSCFDSIAPDLGKYDCFIASRNAKGSEYGKKQPWLRRIMHNVSRKIILGRFHFKGINDTQCGYKVFRSPIIKECCKRQIIDGFAFDVEYLYFLSLNGYSIKEVPVSWADDSKSTIKSPLKTSLAFYKDLGRIKKNKKNYILDNEKKEELSHANR